MQSKEDEEEGKKAKTVKFEPCQNYNRGKCKSTAEGGCPSDPNRLHVCAKCHSPKHILPDCPQNKGQPKAKAAKR